MTTSTLEWNWRGANIRLDIASSGTGPALLLLPALSSISTHHEMGPLAERLAARYSTVCVDWPGFGGRARPQVDWTPDAYSAFLAFLLTSVVPHPHAVIAAGHAASYALKYAASVPQATTRLVLIAPTWRGPLPTVLGERRPLLDRLRRLVDLPGIGPLVYRLNVNEFVVRRMGAGHVYTDPAFLTGERLRQKLAVVRAHRRAVVAGRPTDAAAALRSADPRRTVQGVAPERAPAVAFVFPGQGAQHVGMARELYAHAPVFRAELDRCCELLEAHLGRDLRDLLFAPSGDAESAAALRQTALAQPALFAVEYALARWWTSLGIQPQALLGHSIGEYTAACLAGVFALEDALGLVAARGRLMQALPPGSMLAVPLAEAELRSRLGPELTLAAVNGPDLCVASGPTEAVDALEARLADRGVVGTRLHTSHAFHSAMMDPILASFADLVAQVKLAAPTLPFVSNVTGTWITPEQATDPAYWAEHLRATVRFGDGLATLLAEPSRLLLEVGPGEALTRLASRHPARRVEQATVATLPHPTDRRSDLDAALLAAGHLWTAGLPLDPTGLWPNGGRRVPLPTYPFEHRDHWIVAQAMPTADLTLLARRTDPTDWLFAPSWRRLARPSRAIGTALAESQQWLLFCDEAGLGRRLADRLRAADQRVSCVTAGTGFADLGGGAFRLDPSDRPAYDRLVDALRTGDCLPDRIVHLWSVDDGAAPDAGAPDRAALDRGFYSLLFLSQALGERAVTGPVDLAAVSGPAYVVLGDEEVRPERAAILGPCKVLPQEYVNLTTRAIDVGHPPSEPDRLEALVGRLLGDLIGDPPPGLIAFRGPHRWVQVFEALRIEDSDDAIELRERGVYLITGGLGGIGLAIATYLAQTVRARLVLVGRSAFPAPEAWDPWLAEHSENDPTSARIRALRQIESAGGTVIVEQADVADPAQTAALVRRVLERHGVVHGAVHAAGVLHDGAAQLKTPEVAAAVLAPKVVGTLALARALEGVGCDFIALCSSVSAVLPVAGQIDYCAANAVQDAIANARAGRAGPRMIAINWDAWEDVGMWARTRSSVPRTAESQPERIRAAEGPLAFAHALATGLPQVVVSPYDFAGLMERVTRSTAVSAPTVTVPGTPIAGLGRHERPDIATPFVAPRDEREQHLAGIWQEVLGLEFVGIHDNFFDLGGDSILGIQVVARARQAGLELRPAHLFEYQTIAELAQVGNLAAPPDRATETDDAPLIDLGQQQLELILSQTDRAAQSS